MFHRMFLAAALSLLLLFAGMGAVVLLYFWLISYVSMLQRQRRHRPSEENGKAPKQKGLSAAELQRLPTIESCEEGGNADCAVCLDGFQIGERCRVIPACSHVFHVQCADAWLSKRSVCPICRTSARESKEKNGVNTCATAAALKKESGRCPPAESIVVDMPIAVAPS